MRIVSAILFFVANAAVAATDVPVSAFRSLELSHGGKVIVRNGPVQRVTFLKGDPQYTRVEVDGEQRLVIQTARGECPRGYRVEIEVVTPYLSEVFVSNGGSIEAVDAFPAQPSMEVAVEQGGSIDIRSISANDVTASVFSGGQIFTTSHRTLNAKVRSGGVITYWGEVGKVNKSVRDGGVVKRGSDE
jgi:Putative auto-transporter adhesin, head GIN domain